MNASQRISQLDATRGIAAVLVLLSHVRDTVGSATLPAYQQVALLLDKLSLTPLYLLWGGHQAVLIFFVLSGFVLYLMLERQNLTFFGYIGKRIIRLYIPYIVSIGLAVMLNALLSNGSLDGMGQWFNNSWSNPISWLSILNHVLLLGQFDTNQYNGPIWSLVHEMRISIVFPLVFLTVRRFAWYKNLLGYGALSIVGAISSFTLPVVSSGLGSLSLTLHYLLIFAVGALLAKHRSTLTLRFQTISLRVQLTLLAVGLMFYIYGSKVTRLITDDKFLIQDYGILPGAVILIAIAAFSPYSARLLNNSIMQYLGRISYSLYLTHFIVILCLVHIAIGKVPLPVIVLTAIPMSFLVATIFYRLVEQPSIEIGRGIGALRFKRTDTIATD
ncbi:acyltransferase family protein [Deinococcus apachensis]|uniref:acyltransferase family protein n=1 Tax=Deinococcus apachensis TaxID=309886 RepID=UPI00146E378B|nr:acyltransferase [Deinococcus apachensis]